jgi:hypothetical protein
MPQIRITSQETRLVMVESLLTELTTENKQLRQTLLASRGSARTLRYACVHVERGRMQVRDSARSIMEGTFIRCKDVLWVNH